MKKQSILAAMLAVVTVIGLADAVAQPVAPAASGAPQSETKEQRDARMKWWREARFGMFIHWGVYSVPAGVYHGTNIDEVQRG
jgi:alpha-L-fucosidase